MSGDRIGFRPSSAVLPARLALAGLALLLCQPAAALGQGNMAVYVQQGTSDTMVSGATVCVGTKDNPVRYGVKTTNSQGRVDFTALPGTELLVTATKAGFTGQSRVDPATNYSRAVRFFLQPGSGGPTCPTPTLVVPVLKLGFRITSFSLNDNAAQVTVTQPVTLSFNWDGGTPTHYRASEQQNFAGAQWQPFTASGPRPTFKFSNVLPGVRTVYVQLRDAQGKTTTPASDQILVVRPPRIDRPDPAPATASCRLEIHRADSALSSEPNPTLTELITIQAGLTRKFDSAWPSPNEKRRGFGMHVRRLRNVGPLDMIVYSTVNLAPASLFALGAGQSRNVRLDLDAVVCVA